MEFKQSCNYVYSRTRNCMEHATKVALNRFNCLHIPMFLCEEHSESVVDSNFDSFYTVVDIDVYEVHKA